jgi:hypothetical protein
MNSIESLKQQIDRALTELAQLRRLKAEDEENAFDLARQAADPHPVPLVVFGITQLGDRLRVDLAAASEMAFELKMSPELDYEKAIAELCHVAPAMLAYDAALMESYDSGGKTKVPRVATQPVKDFVERYRKHLVNISVALPPFEYLNTK